MPWLALSGTAREGPSVFIGSFTSSVRVQRVRVWTQTKGKLCEHVSAGDVDQ
jgi:hypothetical protein